MARRKSIDDIEAQRDRIINSAWYTVSRGNKAFDASERYIRNIRRQKGYQENARKATIARLSGKYSASIDMNAENNSRKYSRNTYMGINAG